jgi:hypothetical protein
LIDDSFTTGYCLLAALLFLAAFNVRKCFPFLPQLGSSAGWMQAHIYVGLGTAALFIGHTGWAVPRGTLEQILAGVYLLVFGSGLLGLYWSRSIPRKLTAVREQPIFEQIPLARRRLVGQVRALLFDSPRRSLALCRCYVNRLAWFFERPRPLLYLIRPNGRTRQTLVSEIEYLDRYLAPGQRETSRQLIELVRQKDDLDFQFALQARLKVWLFFHIGLTYSLLPLAVVHGVVALAFHGGGRRPPPAITSASPTTSSAEAPVPAAEDRFAAAAARHRPASR